MPKKDTTPSTNPKSRKGVGGPRNKYDTHVKPNLDVIASWARDGVLEADMAKALNVGVSTFNQYKNQHDELKELLKTNKDVSNARVENALYQNAMNGNVTAQIFFLKNRLPHKWNRKAVEEEPTQVNVTISYDDIMEAERQAKQTIINQGGAN